MYSQKSEADLWCKEAYKQLCWIPRILESEEIIKAIHCTLCVQSFGIMNTNPLPSEGVL